MMLLPPGQTSYAVIVAKGVNSPIACYGPITRCASTGEGSPRRHCHPAVGKQNRARAVRSHPRDGLQWWCPPLPRSGEGIVFANTAGLTTAALETFDYARRGETNDDVARPPSSCCAIQPRVGKIGRSSPVQHEHAIIWCAAAPLYPFEDCAYEPAEVDAAVGDTVIA